MQCPGSSFLLLLSCILCYENSLVSLETLSNLYLLPFFQHVQKSSYQFTLSCVFFMEHHAFPRRGVCWGGGGGGWVYMCFAIELRLYVFLKLNNETWKCSHHSRWRSDQLIISLFFFTISNFFGELLELQIFQNKVYILSAGSVCPIACEYFATTTISLKLHSLGQVMRNRIALLLVTRVLQ